MVLRLARVGRTEVVIYDVAVVVLQRDAISSDAEVGRVGRGDDAGGGVAVFHGDVPPNDITGKCKERAVVGVSVGGVRVIFREAVPRQRDAAAVRDVQCDLHNLSLAGLTAHVLDVFIRQEHQLLGL